LWLYFHELFHIWNGGKLRRTEPDALLYWFSEGITNYFARILELGSGVSSLRDYIDDYNEAISSYYNSSARTEPNSRILKDFWNNPEIEKLPYQRGDMLAHRWNLMIRKANGANSSLDRSMRDVVSTAQSRREKLSVSLWTQVISKDLKEGVLSDINRFIDQGELIAPDDGALGPCVHLKQKRAGKLVHGFNPDQTYSSGRITG
jgi:predicted metalloprotease with PDZ domain